MSDGPSYSSIADSESEFRDDDLLALNAEINGPAVRTIRLKTVRIEIARLE